MFMKVQKNYDRFLKKGVYVIINLLQTRSRPKISLARNLS